MNYSEILLHGWLEACNLYGLSNMANQREAILEGKPLAHLKAYFNKNAKQAEAEGIPRDVFFNACRATLVKIADEIRNVYFRDKLDLSFSKDAMLNGRIKATKEQIAGIEKQLQSMNVYQFFISLFQYSKGRYTGQLYMKEVEMIGLALDEAEKIDLVQQPKPKAEPDKEYSLRQVALMLVYNGETFISAYHKDSQERLNEVAAEYGFTSDNSGLKLYRDYFNKLTKPTDRTGAASPRRMKKDIEGILHELTPEGRKLAEADIHQLELKIH